MTMTKIHVLALPIIAVLALSKAAASTASTSPTWWEEGAELADGEANGMTTTATANTPFIIRASVLGVDTAVECTDLKIVSGLSYNENKSGLDLGKLVFNGCFNLDNCPGVASTVSTLGELSELGKELLPTNGLWVDIFYPNSWGEFLKFSCNGASVTI